MSAVETEKETSGGYLYQNGAGEIGHLADKLEDFPYRIDPGKAPLICKVRPYAITSTGLDAIERRRVELEIEQDQIDRLKKEKGKIEIDLLLDSEYDPDAEPEVLRRINAKLAELESHPTPVSLIAESFFMRVVHSWPFTNLGEPVPLSVEGIMSLPPLLLGDFREQLTSFLSLETRKKKKR